MAHEPGCGVEIQPFATFAPEPSRERMPEGVGPPWDPLPFDLHAEPLACRVGPVHLGQPGTQAALAQTKQLHPFAGQGHHRAESGLGALLHLAQIPLDQLGPLHLMGPQAVGGHHSPVPPGGLLGTLHPLDDLRIVGHLHQLGLGIGGDRHLRERHGHQSGQVAEQVVELFVRAGRPVVALQGLGDAVGGAG
ncbi:MAG: hypothetical protein ACK559_13975 [bacterium]